MHPSDILLKHRKERALELDLFNESIQGSIKAPLDVFGLVEEAPLPTIKDQVRAMNGGTTQKAVGQELSRFCVQRTMELTLEIPFKTDTHSIGIAIQKSCELMKGHNRAAPFQEWIEEEKIPEYKRVRKHIDKLFRDKLWPPDRDLCDLPGLLTP